jgi:branched-chain amino acid transport system substrate-binding protein
MRRQPATLLALLLAVAPDVACRRPAGASAADARELVIGVTLNPQRAGMESIDRGVELAVATLNAELERNPAPGRVARFALRRTPRHVTSAVQAAGLLRDDPAVVGIVGDAESGRTLDAISIIEDAAGDGASALVAVSPTATSPALSGRSPWLFRVCPSDEVSSRAAARYAADTLGARRAAVIYRNDPYGRDWAATFERAFQERGGTLVLRDPYVAGVTEWAALAGYVGRLDADVLLFPGSAEDAAALHRALRAAGVRIPVIGGDPVSGLAALPEFAGVRYLTAFLPERVEGVEARAFIEHYTRRFGTPPDLRAAMAYDAATVIGRAAMAVGGDRARVRDWVAGVGTAHPAIDGVAGPVAFDARHDVVARTVHVATVRAANGDAATATATATATPRRAEAAR